MKQCFLFAAVMLLCTACFAQGTITGSVKSMSTGVPMAVAGHRVYVVFDSTATYHPPHQDCYTNAGGVYTMSLPAAMPAGFHFTVYCADTCTMTIAQSSQIYASPGMYNIPFFICAPGVPHGKVTLGTTGSGAANAKVYCIQKVYNTALGAYTLTAIDSATADGAGNYSMANMLPATAGCTYLIKAALQPSSASYSSYLPTYYTGLAAGSLNWSSAMAQPAPNYIKEDIALTAGTNPGGAAFIGGSVLLGANKSAAVGDPLNMRILILTDQSNNAVAYAYSDASGKFRFNSLSYGTYKVFGDAMGKQNPPLTVTVSAAKSSVSNIVFEENSSKFEGHLNTTGVTGVSGQLSQISVCPNPAIDVLHVQGLGTVSGMKSLTLLNAAGAVISTQQTSESTASLQMASLPAGTYLLRISTEAGVTVYHIVR